MSEQPQRPTSDDPQEPGDREQAQRSATAGRHPEWEYCQLFSVTLEMPAGTTALAAAPGQVARAETRYYLRVLYMGPDGRVVERELAAFDQSLATNPFYPVMGLLGGAGWELVALAGGRDSWSDEEGREVLPYRVGWRPSSRTAYLKRQVRAGRPVEEPRLTL
jgi:hypothetical protein